MEYMRLAALVPIAVLMAPASAQDHPAAGKRENAAWAVLNAGLMDNSSDHRRQAVLAAESIGATADTVRFICGALNDKDVLVRQTAAAALGQLDSPQSLACLQQALTDNSEVSFTAAKGLVDRNDPGGRLILEQVLTGARKDRPGFLEQNLKKAKKELTPAELALTGVKEAAGVLFGPASIGIVVVEKVVKNSRSNQGEISGRAIAAATLAEHPDDYTRPLLEWVLSDDDAGVRAAAAKGLGKCGNEASVDKLRTAMNDHHAAVRYFAAAAVIRIGLAGNGL
jgi:HEAT repeat protein